MFIVNRNGDEIVSGDEKIIDSSRFTVHGSLVFKVIVCAAYSEIGCLKLMRKSSFAKVTKKHKVHKEKKEAAVVNLFRSILSTVNCEPRTVH